MITIRPAQLADDAVLVAVDDTTWSTRSTPSWTVASSGPALVEDGVLREEFLLDGAYVADVRMARFLD